GPNRWSAQSPARTSLTIPNRTVRTDTMASPLNAARRHAGVPHDPKDYRSLPGPWMRGRVHLSELVDRDQRVDLCGRHGGMAEQLLHHPNVGAAVEKVGCEGMSQYVRRYPGESGTFGGGLQHLPGALPGEPPAAGVAAHGRGAAPVGEQAGPGPHEVGVERGAGVAAERDDAGAPALGAQPHLVVLQVVD